MAKLVSTRRPVAASSDYVPEQQSNDASANVSSSSSRLAGIALILVLVLASVWLTTMLFQSNPAPQSSTSPSSSRSR